MTLIKQIKTDKLEKNENVKYRNSTVVSGVSCVSGVSKKIRARVFLFLIHRITQIETDYTDCPPQ